MAERKWKQGGCKSSSFGYVHFFNCDMLTIVDGDSLIRLWKKYCSDGRDFDQVFVEPTGILMMLLPRE